MKKRILIIITIIFIVALLAAFLMLFFNNTDESSKSQNDAASETISAYDKVDFETYPILKTALDEEGNTGGEKYWKWYGYDEHVLWCACFVSWCANEINYIESGVLPMFSNCRNEGIPWFKERDQWEDSSYIPNPADIIFFDNNTDSVPDHVGIVLFVEDNKIHTIEGNAGDVCRIKEYHKKNERIYGYGTPEYH